MVEIKALSAGYSGKEVLHGVDISFTPGEITALIGPNGCGKSTLLKSVVGLCEITGGEILADGIPVRELSTARLAQRVAYLPQERAVPEMTVMRMVLHGRFAYLSYPRRYRPQDIEAAREALRQMDMEQLSGQRLSSLSGGTRQKVYIAMALAQDSPTLLMDEPTTFLDVAHRIRMMETARKLADSGKAVAMVLHDLDLALGCCDKIAVMSNGRITGFGDPDYIFESRAVDNSFGVTLCRFKADNSWRYYCKTSF